MYVQCQLIQKKKNVMLCNLFVVNSIKSTKGRVVLRGDIVKDDSGPYAAFTEHRSSASQMAAAKAMDIISRLPGFPGQAADAVSAYAHVKMEDASTLMKNSKVSVSRYLDTSTTTRCVM